MLEVRVDTNQARPTTLALRYWPGGGGESEPCVHTYLSVALDAQQVRRLIEVLEKGIGGDGQW